MMAASNRTNCCRFNRQCFGRKSTIAQQFVHLVHLLLCRKQMEKMNRSEFETYLGYFNNRAYEQVHRYFADDIVLKFAGYELAGKNSIRRFYRFFHDHVDEHIIVHQFAGDDENVIIDVTVRLEAKKSLTSAALKANGYERLVSLGRGEVVEIPQFIHYRIEKDQFKEIRCVIKE